ncbi:MAG: amidohydrolase [Candidatus Kapaibacterium sp.]|nr:MAG: amidohydrolase [Candidatus Kapabacteria bacterium]
MELQHWLTAAREHSEQIIAYRRHLHQHPELSFAEHRTHDFISSVLQRAGITPHTVAQTGVVATIGTGERSVAIRADIDALPITERTGLPFASECDGVMHACGHDCHTAMLLGAALMLKQHEHMLPGRVLLIFQPGEEKSPGGASLVIADGVLDRYHPEAIFGQHLYPDAPTGTIELTSGPIMASADELYWTLHGKGSHAAQPHKGSNPIRAAAELIVHLEGIVQQRRDPLHPAVLAVTAIEGGTATNVVPDCVRLKGTLRSFDDQWRRQMWNRIEAHSRVLASLHDVECTVEIVTGYPPLVNNPEATNHARAVAQQLVGTDHVRTFEPKMWAEDFAFYAERIPAAFWMLGCRPPERSTMPGLHSPLFNPDEDALPIGAAMLAAVATAWLAR